MKNILILVLITLTFNLNASSIYEGKWYKFTDDFIRNCFDGFEQTQENVNETAGKTSSFANSLTKKELDDCLTGAPYLDTDPQVDPRDFGGNNSCAAIYISSDKMNLPSAANGQTVELTSADGKVTAKYKCSNGSWGNAFDRVDIRDAKNSCTSICLKWDGNGNISTCSSLSEVSGNASSCGNVLLGKEHGKVVKAVSQSNYLTGSAQFFCNNGNWNLVAGTATCVSQACNINETVAWSDRDVIALTGTVGNSIPLNTGTNGTNTSGTNDDDDDDSNLRFGNINGLSTTKSLSELRNELSILSANGKSVDHVVEQIMNYEENETLAGGLDDINSSVNGIIEDPFEDDPELREKLKCISEVRSVNGILGSATFIKEDRRIFSSLLEAQEEHKNMVGNANFTCIKGNWVVDTATANCRRNTAINCNNTVVLGIKDGEDILGYYCE